MATQKCREHHAAFNYLEHKFWILLKGFACLEIPLEEKMNLIVNEWKTELQCECSGYICIHKAEFVTILISGTADGIFNPFLCQSISVFNPFLQSFGFLTREFQSSGYKNVFLTSWLTQDFCFILTGRFRHSATRTVIYKSIQIP